MKSFSHFLALVVLVLGSWPSFSRADLITVEYVDVSRYLGRWYQISRNPLPFEPAGCHCAQQTLGVKENGNVSVYNSCNKDLASGELTEIRGEAINDDPKTNARFTVDFGLPRKGQYWIIGLGENYEYAVVSEPSKRSLYILSKTPVLEETLYQEALVKAGQVGTENLVKTNHEGCVYPESK